MSDAFRPEGFSKPQSFSTESGATAHQSVYLEGEDLRFSSDDLTSTALDEAKARTRLEVERLQDELYLLQDRLATIKARAKNLVSAQGSSINASAHAQLGDYPWLKLAGASIASFVFGKVVRHVPLGLVAGLALRNLGGSGRGRSSRRR